MNWLVLPTLVIGFGMFFLGRYWAGRKMSLKMRVAGWVAVLVLAVPGVLYAAYYSRLLGEPVWLYRLRTIGGSELLASLAGLAAGWVQARVVPKLRVSGLGKRLVVPALLGFGLALPYLKPVLRPLAKDALRDVWEDGVCMQSSGATCGPASAATVLKALGVEASERELAEEAFSCASGTENWYLARGLRRRGMATAFVRDEKLDCSLPAIAGVRLRNAGMEGHFVALLGREGGGLVVADPVEGRFTNTLEELRAKYEFTGFVMVISGKGR